MGTESLARYREDIPERLCAECGTRFKPAGPNGKYCGGKCKKLSLKRNKPIHQMVREAPKPVLPKGGPDPGGVRYVKELDEVLGALERRGLTSDEWAARFELGMRKALAKDNLLVFKEMLKMWLELIRGKGNGPKFTGNTFNIGLGEDERERVSKLLELFEAEAKRRGVSGVLPGGVEVTDAEALPGVVDVSSGEEEVVGPGAS